MTKKILQDPRIIEFKFKWYPLFQRGPNDGERVILEGDKVTFERNHPFNDSNLVVSSIPSKSQWDEFIDFLDRKKIWNWKKDYLDYDVLDGSAWSLLIKTTSLKIESHGTNKKPSNFNELLRSINKLMGIEVFEIFEED
ncbi:hypothetical protein ABXT44_04240 [Candidatus Pseudothioglobus sp. Uisw_041]|jgi:hypothetical protein|uniref:hypothetical protein n=1 Tax=Candidatus Pseudothioglobus sp. Uisw_041 TaxID=3230996 RepID=UPI003A847D4D